VGIRKTTSKPPLGDSGAKRIKNCFFVSRIGSPDSEERRFSDKLLTHIVSPVLSELGYDNPIRADQITTPGTITTQVFGNLWSADLVIADLTGKNVNVFYELAVRHLSKRPFVQMIHKEDSLPFDIAAERTIHFGFDIDEVPVARRSLQAMIRSADQDPLACKTVLSNSIELSVSSNDVTVHKETVERMVSILEQLDTYILTPARINEEAYRLSLFHNHLAKFLKPQMDAVQEAIKNIL
jgi:hypothetical protein